jgi:hypothetical protein
MNYLAHHSLMHSVDIISTTTVFFVLAVGIVFIRLIKETR